MNCPLCEAQFFEEDSMWSHVWMAHTSGAMIPCWCTKSWVGIEGGDEIAWFKKHVEENGGAWQHLVAEQALSGGAT